MAVLVSDTTLKEQVKLTRDFGENSVTFFKYDDVVYMDTAYSLVFKNTIDSDDIVPIGVVVDRDERTVNLPINGNEFKTGVYVGFLESQSKDKQFFLRVKITLEIKKSI